MTSPSTGTNMLFGLTQKQWDAEAAAAQDYLQNHAKRGGELITYGQLFDELERQGHKRPEMFQISSGRLLGDVALMELEGKRPPLTALVVNQDRMIPGTGFWDILKRGCYASIYDLTDKDAAWFAALKDVRDYWATGSWTKC